MRHEYDTVQQDGTAPHRTKKHISTIAIVVAIIYSHPHTSQSTVVPRRKQATKLQGRPAQEQEQQQQQDQAAARPGQVGRLAIDRTLPPPPLLAGEPYKVALTCKGPSERAEELGCSLPISIPSRLVVLPSPFLEVVVSSHVVWCASLRCAVLFAQDESMKRDECSWMETDGVASRLPSSRLSLPSFALLPAPLALQHRSLSYKWTMYCMGELGSQVGGLAG